MKECDNCGSIWMKAMSFYIDGVGQVCLDCWGAYREDKGKRDERERIIKKLALYFNTSPPEKYETITWGTIEYVINAVAAEKPDASTQLGVPLDKEGGAGRSGKVPLRISGSLPDGGSHSSTCPRSVNPREYCNCDGYKGVLR